MEAAATQPSPDGSAGSPRAWPDWLLLALVMLLSAAMHAWLIAHTEVAARDSIGYIRYALQLQDKPWREVLKHSEQHPIYPLTVLAVSLPVRHLLGGTTCESMVLSCQVASSLAAVLLVIPMFYLGRELFDRRVGLWSAALFQCLPVSARLTADALSEATFLLMVATLLLLAARALRSQSPLRFALCGLFGGLAYLTRPEGALAILATGLVLIGMQTVPGWRRSWGKLIACGASLAGAALLVASPYMATIGGFTIKPTPYKLLHGGQDVPGCTQRAATVRERCLRFAKREPVAACSTYGAPDSPPLLAMVPAIWWDWNRGGPPWWWGLHAQGYEVMKGYDYLVWLPVLVGLWWFRGRLRRSPGAWVLLVLAGLHGLVLWRMAEIVGYLSERHVQLLILCGVFWAAAAITAMGDWLAGLSGRAWLSWALPLLLIGIGVPASLKSLHTNRTGHRAAGAWLAAHIDPLDPVVDPFCWAHFYAGKVFLEEKVLPVPPGFQVHEYVVLEDSTNPHERLPVMPIALALAKQGKLVYHWEPARRSRDQPGVSVYRVPAE